MRASAIRTFSFLVHERIEAMKNRKKNEFRFGAPSARRSTPGCRFPGVGAWIVAALVGLPAVTGCRQDDGRVAVYPVKGKVTVAGVVPAGALVVLYPQAGGDGTLRPSGKVKADGTFALTTFEADDGAPAGEYVATVQWNKLIKRGQDHVAGPNVIAKRYSDRDASIWKINVAAAPNELEPLTIVK
jgi:hypothetical protein